MSVTVVEPLSQVRGQNSQKFRDKKVLLSSFLLVVLIVGLSKF